MKDENPNSVDRRKSTCAKQKKETPSSGDKGGVVARPGASKSVKALLAVETLCAFFGYVGGIMFFLDPSGKSYGLDFALANLPVRDFLLVGLWLVAVYGVGFSLVAYSLQTRKPWAWISAVGLSLVWIGWIIMETVLLGFSPFIEIWLVPPVAAMILLVWPGMRSQLRMSHGTVPAT